MQTEGPELQGAMEEEKVVSMSALPDTRPQADKDKDYIVDEIAADVAVVPFENSRIDVLTATVYNQWLVGSCVPHGIITQLEYEGLIPPNLSISQLRAYRKRLNYAQPGCIGPDMYDKIKHGQSNDFPTPAHFTENQATAMPYVAGDRLIDDFNYFQYKKEDGTWDVEQIVKDIAIGKAIAPFIYATDAEWAREYVDIITPNLALEGAEVRHCVCLIPSGDFTENGRQWVSVHDSAKFGGRHLRYVTYEFLKKRLYFGAKVYKGAEIPVPPTPPHVDLPLVACEQGNKGENVLNLQEYLIEKGFLEKNYATSYFGAISAKALLWFQLFHHDKFSSKIPEILGWGGKYWGPQSIKVVEELG